MTPQADLQVVGDVIAHSLSRTGGALRVGTTDDQPLEFEANDQRGLRLEYGTNYINPNGYQSMNLIGGYWGNDVAAGNVGVVIAGGGALGGSTGPNSVDANSHWSSIGGGEDNAIGSDALHATIAGGSVHRIGQNALGSAIGGGLQKQHLGQLVTCHDRWRSAEYDWRKQPRECHRGRRVEYE